MLPPSPLLPSPPFLFLAVFLFFTLSLLLLLSRFKTTRDGREQPPGPLAWPVIGNLHLLGTLPHRSLHSLARRYGPIMSLRLGQVPAVVVSSPEAAELFLKTHDVVFASRPRTQASEFLSYGSKGIAFAEYGPYWRDMRKLCTLQLFSASRVEMFRPIRREELREAVKSIKESAAARDVVDVSEKVGEVIEDIIYRIILGRKRDDRFDLKRIVQETLSLSGAFNIADFLPFLRPFDIQGFTKRLKTNGKEIDEMLETIIKEHEEAQAVLQKMQHKDIVDILLSCLKDSHDDEQNPVKDRTNIKAILLDLLSGAIDTSVTVSLWVFSELLKNPRVMKKLQHELENLVGKSNLVEEVDLPRLTYLDMVVKETLRLHPVAPLLLPRVSTKDITINGYYIRNKSRVIVNVWAIGRDPKIWSDNAEAFYPKRFLNSNVDLRGKDFQLIPFGSGRTGCPGMQLGLITVKLVIAQLMHCFNWELPQGVSPDEVDMTEKFGLLIPRANHLVALPSYCLAE
ncbi:cytochrome P450 CYP736A12-like [Neltuma alba]|uniref:cytochrome P450 CYP736A12-like n=1 Tax=Neltuma alba TaxID=207710 RepID=UPI0010A2B6C0|nr:cytochrome P450 CYP736A12-like [Prosopis alba]